MWKWIQAIINFFAPKVKAKIAPAQPTQNPAQVVWPNYDCGAKFYHGSETEDVDRNRWVSECIAAGKDCLKVTLDRTFNGEIWIRLWDWPSNVDGHFVDDSWFRRATYAGIKRWVIDVRIDDAAWIAHAFHSSEPNTVQFLCDPKLRVEISDLMKLDENGVKIAAADRTKGEL